MKYTRPKNPDLAVLVIGGESFGEVVADALTSVTTTVNRISAESVSYLEEIGHHEFVVIDGDDLGDEQLENYDKYFHETGAFMIVVFDNPESHSGEMEHVYRIIGRETMEVELLAALWQGPNGDTNGGPVVFFIIGNSSFVEIFSELGNKHDGIVCSIDDVDQAASLAKRLPYVVLITDLAIGEERLSAYSSLLESETCTGFAIGDKITEPYEMGNWSVVPKASAFRELLET